MENLYLNKLKYDIDTWIKMKSNWIQMNIILRSRR